MPRMAVQLHVMENTSARDPEGQPDAQRGRGSREKTMTCSCLSLIGEKWFPAHVGLKEPMLSLQRQLVSGTAAVTGMAVQIVLPSGELLGHMPSSMVAEECHQYITSTSNL